MQRNRILVSVLLGFFFFSCGPKKTASKNREKPPAKAAQTLSDPMAAFREVTLAMVRGDGDKVLTLTTKRLQKEIATANRQAIARLKGNKQMEARLEKEFHKPFPQIAQLSDENLVRHIIARSKAPEAQRPQIEEQVKKTRLLNKKETPEGALIITFQGEKGKPGKARLVKEEGGWKLDGIQ